MGVRTASTIHASRTDRLRSRVIGPDRSRSRSGATEGLDRELHVGGRAVAVGGQPVDDEQDVVPGVQVLGLPCILEPPHPLDIGDRSARHVEFRDPWRGIALWWTRMAARLQPRRDDAVRRQTRESDRDDLNCEARIIRRDSDGDRQVVEIHPRRIGEPTGLVRAQHDAHVTAAGEVRQRRAGPDERDPA